ncbi:hypothetical protein SUGI_0713330 [Cryptomeria japonica]|nr:hypothetical protein SUGI_0713330 [Cryptomeria japonica]
MILKFLLRRATPFLEGILNMMKTPDPKATPPSLRSFLDPYLEEGEICERKVEQEELKVEECFREKKGYNETTLNVLKQPNPNTMGENRRSICTSEHIEVSDKLLNLIPELLNDVDNELLMFQVSKEEVKEAVFAMVVFKAPGPDDFPSKEIE